MKAVVKRAIRDQRGVALTLVLVLLLLGGLILTPLLGLMGTGLLAGRVYEEGMHRYYAADAGVEHAIWTIEYDPPNSYPYTYPDPLIVGGKSVDITVFREDVDPTCGEELRYRVLSTATTDNGGGTADIGSSTTIDAYLSVSYMDFSALLDYVIVSNSTIRIQPNNDVDGKVWLPHEEDLGGCLTCINGTVEDEDDVSITWPTPQQLSSYYSEDVEGAYDPGSFIDIKYLNPKTIGPWHREGSLAVDNTGAPATITLEDTVYVTGDLQFLQPSEGRNYTVDLNGQTIFVEGSVYFAPQYIAVSGSGCIIAVGNVNFQPSIASEADDFVLVMSITGETVSHPSGDFTGCIVGDTHVQLQPGCAIDWISPEGKGLHFPMGVGDGNELPPVTDVSILCWEIS